MDERIREPTTHQKSLARMLRHIADALDSGEVSRSTVAIHYGIIEVANNWGIGDFRVKKLSPGVQMRGTRNRLISIALHYYKDPPNDLISEIAKQECMV